MEFTEDAAVIKDEYVERCERLLAQVEKHEEEQKELERLRAEKVALEQKEREERLVKEAEERGKREAEEAAKREIEKVQAAAFAAQEKIRIEREAEFIHHFLAHNPTFCARCFFNLRLSFFSDWRFLDFSKAHVDISRLCVYLWDWK